MKQAVIVSAARTGLAKSFRGSLNMTHGATMGGHAVQSAVERSGIPLEQFEDCIMGCGFPEGVTGQNIARQVALRAGMPISTAGMTINRYCSSGLQSIALAANAITQEGAGPMIAGGVESISLVQSNVGAAPEPWLREHKPAVYMSMIETADIVAERYGVSREEQDAYGLRSQERIAAAQDSGKFADEIVPMRTVMAVKDKETGEVSHVEVTVDRDECNRPNTTLAGLQGLQPVREGGFVRRAMPASFRTGQPP